MGACSVEGFLGPRTLNGFVFNSILKNLNLDEINNMITKESGYSVPKKSYTDVEVSENGWRTCSSGLLSQIFSSLLDSVEVMFSRQLNPNYHDLIKFKNLIIKEFKDKALKLFDSYEKKGAYISQYVYPLDKSGSLDFDKVNKFIIQKDVFVNSFSKILEKSLNKALSKENIKKYKSDDLMDTIKSDYLFINSKGFSNEEIADELSKLMSLARSAEKSGKDYIIYNKEKLKFKNVAYRGMQLCPFPNDDNNIGSNSDFTFINNKGDKISFSAMLPGLIKHYCFFEGEGTSYRVSPDKIIKFLKLTPKKNVKLKEEKLQLKNDSKKQVKIKNILYLSQPKKQDSVCVKVGSNKGSKKRINF